MLQLACEREEVTRPLEDWRLWEGLMKGGYASVEVLLGWLPGHTRCAVAIDLGEDWVTKVFEDSRHS